MAIDASAAALEPGIQDYSSPEWLATKRGLVAYRRALIFKIIFGIAGGVILVAMGASMSFDSLQTYLVASMIFVVASASLTIWMVFGLWKYARVPADTGARGVAATAMVISALGMLVEFYYGFLFARVVFGGQGSLTSLSEISDSSLKMIANLGGLVGFICLVVSLKRVAISVGAHEVRDRISSFVSLIIVMVCLIVGAVLLPIPFLGLLIGLALLILAIVALVKFLAILQKLGEAIGGLDVSKVFD